MGNYISVSDIRAVPLKDRLMKANWSDNDIEVAINEAESYIEGRLVKIGYSRNQLQRSQLVKTLCLNYCRYVILRDIYTMMSPSTSAGEEYTKWKEEVDKILDFIEKNNIRLVDKDTGELLVPEKREIEIKTTTKDVPRAISMGPNYEWSISNEYFSDEITNKK
jgi:hypothetical protein